jgi:transcriptional regulator with GAF, ATPase, and Fis domain
MSTAIVGREPELSAVDSFLDAAASSLASLLIEGEPGIGKTTICHEAIRRAEACGYRTHVCRPCPHGSAIPRSVTRGETGKGVSSWG